jgi:F-type H+-transporting ATPase subunit a
MATFVLLLLVVLIPLLRRGLSVHRPSHGQQTLEMLVSALRDMLDDVVGHHSHRFLPLIGTFAVFIFVSNFMGLLPGLTAPTSNLNVTFSLGIFSFLYYNTQGFKESGVKYLAHFLGPVAFMAPLMLVIELFSHMFRPVSLAVRLYGNMNGEHILGGVFLNNLGPYPFLYPVLVMALGLFTCLLQSYIFVMLSMVYIAGAVAHEH